MRPYHLRPALSRDRLAEILFLGVCDSVKRNSAAFLSELEQCPAAGNPS
jgi:hypothetical protein